MSDVTIGPEPREPRGEIRVKRDDGTTLEVSFHTEAMAREFAAALTRAAVVEEREACIDILERLLILPVGGPAALGKLQNAIDAIRART